MKTLERRVTWDAMGEVYLVYLDGKEIGVTTNLDDVELIYLDYHSPEVQAAHGTTAR